MTTYAQITTRNAFLWFPFGLEMATRYFGTDVIDALPRFARGKHKGEIKAQIEWQKVDRGGWVSEGNYGDGPAGYVERRVGKVIAVRIKTAEWGEDSTVIKSWTRPADTAA